MAKYGTINVGDVVKYSNRAKKEIRSAIENKLRYHIVSSVENDGQWTGFEEGSGCDTAWLVVVARVAKI